MGGQNSGPMGGQNSGPMGGPSNGPSYRGNMNTNVGNRNDIHALQNRNDAYQPTSSAHGSGAATSGWTGNMKTMVGNRNDHGNLQDRNSAWHKGKSAYGNGAYPPTNGAMPVSAGGLRRPGSESNPYLTRADPTVRPNLTPGSVDAHAAVDTSSSMYDFGGGTRSMASSSARNSQVRQGMVNQMSTPGGAYGRVQPGQPGFGGGGGGGGGQQQHAAAGRRVRRQWRAAAGRVRQRRAWFRRRAGSARWRHGRWTRRPGRARRHGRAGRRAPAADAAPVADRGGGDAAAGLHAWQ